MGKKVKKTKKVDPMEKLVNQVSAKLEAGLKDILTSKMSKANKKKKAKVMPKVKMTEGKVKLYNTSDGKAVTMVRSEAKEIGTWMKALLNRDFSKMREIHQKLEPLNEGTDAEGGYLVPTLLYNKLIPLLEDEQVIKTRATVIDMSGMKTNELDISGISSKPVAQWGSEKAQKATSSMTFNQIDLTPYKLAAIVPITTELRDDSPFNIVAIVTKALGEAYAKAEEQAFARGNGTGRPTGIDNYTAGKSIDAGGALAWNHLNSIYWRLPQAYRNKAVWLMNGRTIEVVSYFRDDNNRPLLLDNGIMTQPGVPALKGRPVLEQNDLPSSSVYFIDLSAYYIGEKLPMKVDIADQATVAGQNLWERNMIAIRIEGRVDGELSTVRAMGEITNSGVS